MPFFLHQWISSQDRASALIKYEIRLFEGYLHRYFLNNDILTHSEKVVSLCNSLAQFYVRLLELNHPTMEHSKKDNFKSTGEDWGSCYTQIQILKQRLLGNLSREKEVQILVSLAQAYRTISQCSLTGKPTCIEALNGALLIKPLLNAQYPQEWITALFELSDTKDFNLNLTVIADLEPDEISHLAYPFKEDRFRRVINAIFYFKVHPETLFKKDLTPDNLISIKNRLSLLYEFIEKLHSNLSQVFYQNGWSSFPDYLFHSEDIPPGVDIPISESDCEMIQTMLAKSLEVKSPEFHFSRTNHAYDFFSAYKFWFNPNRLIDIAMVIHQEFSQESVGSFGFQQQMALCFQPFTTTECLDLYGYFSNKDSCYLMRTLLAIRLGLAHSWLPHLNPNEQAAICKVYDVLDSIMEALRNELASRHIYTEPYSRDVFSKEISPRSRNRNAILRILVLYSKECVHYEDTVIEKLFKEAETTFG